MGDGLKRAVSAAKKTRRKTMSGEALLAYVNARDSGATSVRDAAHEAFHAITVGLRGSWERERLHAALCRHLMFALSPSRLWVHEVHARVVEQKVCEALGVSADNTIDKWLFTSAMEAIKSRMPHAEPSASLAIADAYAATKQCEKDVARVLKLAVVPKVLDHA
jgi:hypothetical protein